MLIIVEISTFSFISLFWICVKFNVLIHPPIFRAFYLY
jgi:hypothetical protein